MWTIAAAKSACVCSVASSHEEYCQNGHRCCHARRKGAQTGAYKPELGHSPVAVYQGIIAQDIHAVGCQDELHPKS